MAYLGTPLDNQVTLRNGGSTVIFRADIFMKSEASNTLSRTAILEFKRSFRLVVTLGFILTQITVVYHAKLQHINAISR